MKACSTVCIAWHTHGAYGTHRSTRIVWLYLLWQAFIAVSTEAPQLDQNYIHERVRAYAAGMQASTYHHYLPLT